MAKDPAFLFYSKDWLEGTAELSIEAKGVYVDLLCYQHQRGDLPSDTTKLARLARLSPERFQEVWEEIGDKFERTDNRMVNRKLYQVMSERSLKGKKNRIIGTFASILRKADLDKKTYNSIRSDFNPDDFMLLDSERITERLTEWITERLKSIANANVNEDYKVLFNKVSAELKIKLDPAFSEVILTWLKYKSERGQSYKSTGLKTLIEKLLKDTGGNSKTARDWVESSMFNNYSGIYPPKEMQNQRPEPPMYKKLPA